MSKKGLQLSNGSYIKLIMILTVIFHGTTLFYTYEKTYDAFVHIFFASHYDTDWFSVWSQKWYTGFTTISYPPLIHQCIALLSKVIGLKLAFICVAVTTSLVFVSGVYRFSKIWVSRKAALMATAASVLSTSFIESLHIFGQLPSLTGIALLLHLCPEVYHWLRRSKNHHFIATLLLFGVTSSTHHVSTIFGMVFFVFPVIGKGLIENSASSYREKRRFVAFLLELKDKLFRLLLLGISAIIITIVVIFPYWYWSKTDPISQVPIPHGSRDSFFEVLSSGLVFFLIPWGLMLFFLPYLLKRLLEREHVFLLFSIGLAFLLGTGGTTPLPRMMLGEHAYNILTLDRFTIWATVLSLPFWGEALLLLFKSKNNWIKNGLIGVILISTLFIINIDYFQKLQPTKIDVEPIADFMHRDQHSDWRYMTLGFGDQMAWLSANCDALSVDGNYHSARRLPALTSRAVERIENSKYHGLEGISVLHEFLTQADNYHLKYVFSNDQFYDPVLYFTGWKSLGLLENKIQVWEKPDIKPLPKLLPWKDIPTYQKLIWGLLPGIFLISTLLFFLLRIHEKEVFLKRKNISVGNRFTVIQKTWVFILTFVCIIWVYNIFIYNNAHSSKERIITKYFEAIDYKKFDEAYSYIWFDTPVDYELFFKSLSIQNGILNSYAKLDTVLITNIESLNKNNAIAEVTTTWLTSLHEVNKSFTFNLLKKNNKWYIQAPELDISIPSDQLRALPDVSFNQLGRRKIDDDRTNRKDILDRPKIEILQTNLVKMDTTYQVVGEVMNIDVDPAFMTVTAVAYDDKGNEVEKRVAGEYICPHLLSMEKTSFKIVFRNKNIADFKVFAKALVNPTRFYKYTGVQNQRIYKSGKITGEIVNFGNEEMTVPQLLINQYGKDKRILDVTKYYMDTGIRSQRTQEYEMTIANNSDISIIKAANPSNIYINGSIQKSLKTRTLHKENDLTRVSFDKVAYISTQQNAFVKYE